MRDIHPTIIVTFGTTEGLKNRILSSEYPAVLIDVLIVCLFPARHTERPSIITIIIGHFPSFSNLFTLLSTQSINALRFYNGDTFIYPNIKRTIGHHNISSTSIIMYGKGIRAMHQIIVTRSHNGLIQAVRTAKTFVWCSAKHVIEFDHI